MLSVGMNQSVRFAAILCDYGIIRRGYGEKMEGTRSGWRLVVTGALMMTRKRKADDKKMNGFVTTSESRSVTAHEIGNKINIV